MKILLLILLLLLSFVTNAQVSDSELLKYEGRSFGRTFSERIKQTRKVLNLAQKVASEQGISTKVIQLKTLDGQSYPALQISPQGSSLQNREASRVARTMSQLPLILSPYDLSFGSSAFFDPNGSKLGVPYAFLTEGITNDSYLHELYHAGTYLKVLGNQEALWGGVMKVLKGEYLSTHNTQYYFRFASLDEITATALSIKLNTQALQELQRNLTPAEFNRSRGAADRRLGKIYYSILAGRYLAKQIIDVTTRSLAILNHAKIQPTKLSLGNRTSVIYESNFLLDSFSRKMVNSRGTFVATPEGMSFTLYSATAPNQSHLEKRLLKLRARATTAEKLFSELEKKIYVVIEHPDISRTDVRSLEALAAAPFEVLD
jgi:hypothetical protein